MNKSLSFNECQIKGRWKNYRVQVSTPPIFPNGVAISLRPMHRPLKNLKKLFMNADTEVEKTITAFFQKQKNVLIVGETSSGKTALLRWWIHSYLTEQRLIIIDDSKELSGVTDSPHVLSFVYSSETEADDILKTSLRFRPDKIIMGECRGRETISMLQSLRTGHWGSFSTLHASSLEDTMIRLNQIIQNYSSHYNSEDINQLINPVSGVIVLKRESSNRMIKSIHWKEGSKWMSRHLFF